MHALPPGQRFALRLLRIASAVLLSLWFAGCGAFSTMIGNLTGLSEAQALRQQGVPGQAVVRRLWDTGITLNDDPVVGLQVEVRRPGRASYETTIPKTLVSRLLLPSVQPGRKLPVWIDPADPKRVAIDPDAVNALPPRDGQFRPRPRKIENENKAPTS